jgi:signal transduction histidine kinase/streptogramin lyase
LTSDIVRAIFSDREGNLWIGTEGGGLNRLNQGKVRTISASDGLSNGFIRAVRQMRDGKIWLGTEGGGVNVLADNRVVEIYDTANGLTNNFITSIYEENSGAVWVGTLEGLNLIRNGKIQRFTRSEGLAGTTVWTVRQTRDGAIWVGTAGGLTRMQNGAAKNFTVADGLPESNVRVLHEDRAGRLWIAAREGSLARYENGKFTVLKNRGDWNKIVAAFYEDAEGALWMATNDGLARYRNDEFRFFTTADGLFHDNLHQILEDADGRFWLGTSGGIFSVAKNELEDLANGRIEKVKTVSLTAADGMKSSECTGEAQPAGWRMNDGELWFPTIKGAAIVNPRKIRFNELPPPVQIEKIVLERQEIDRESFLEFPAGANELEFHYTALSFSAPENVRFKYRLEGLEQDWVEAGTRRTAFYTSLPPGRYRFQVIASNNDGVWNLDGASFDFYQKPFFYQTKTFYVLCFLAAVALVWLVYRWRVAQIEQRFQAVTAERNRIAREWHDTLAAGIAAIAWQLESGLKQFSESPPAARQSIELALKMVKHSMTEARRVLWDLRSNQTENGDLTSALGESVKQLTNGKNVVADYKVGGTPRELPGDVARNLLRICQEAVSNAVAHARAKHLQVSLLFETKFVALQIIDDGCGFDPQKPPSDGIGHFGLIGMRERAQKLGGKFDVKSRLGGGTRVTVEVPLK